MVPACSSGAIASCSSGAFRKGYGRGISADSTREADGILINLVPIARDNPAGFAAPSPVPGSPLESPHCANPAHCLVAIKVQPGIQITWRRGRASPLIPPLPPLRRQPWGTGPEAIHGLVPHRLWQPLSPRSCLQGRAAPPVLARWHRCEPRLQLQPRWR